jgi:hypothetical protein
VIMRWHREVIGMKKMYKIMLAILMVTAMAFGIAYACESESLSHSNGLFYGHGNPTNTDGASENDLYLNLDGNTLWQLQRVTTGDGHGHDGVTTYEWVQIDTLQGANGKDGTNGKDGEDGTNGVDGKNGADGNRFFFGAYDPENIPANEGDIFLDTRTYDLYAYGSGWAVIGNIKGATGANGKDGINALVTSQNAQRLLEFFSSSTGSQVKGIAESDVPPHSRLECACSL